MSLDNPRKDKKNLKKHMRKNKKSLKKNLNIAIVRRNNRKIINY